MKLNKIVILILAVVIGTAMVGCGEKEKQKSGEKAEMKTYKVAMEPVADRKSVV